MTRIFSFHIPLNAQKTNTPLECSGTGLFDQAFSESVVDWYDFDYSGSPFDPKLPPWIRVEGVMDNFVKTVCSDDWIATPPKLNTQVTGIVMNPFDPSGQSVNVTYLSNRSQEVVISSAVFNSTTLGCLSQMDLGDLLSQHDPFPQWTAIRSLSYDSAAKVAIKFKTAWWINEGNEQIGWSIDDRFPYPCYCIPILDGRW